MVLKRTMNVSIVVRKIQLITLFLTDDLYQQSTFAPTIEEKLFGIISGPYEKEILRKFNYTILFMKYYIYTSKMHSQGIYLSIFVNKVLFKYRIESFTL